MEKRDRERERPRPGPVSRPTRLMRMQSDNVRSKSKYKVGSTTCLSPVSQISHAYLFQSLSSIRKLGRQRVRKQGNNSNLSLYAWYFRICQAHTVHLLGTQREILKAQTVNYYVKLWIRCFFLSSFFHSSETHFHSQVNYLFFIALIRYVICVLKLKQGVECHRAFDWWQ